MFKVKNRNRRRREICSKLTIKTLERRHSGVFIVIFEHISHLFLVFPMLILSRKCRLGRDSDIDDIESVCHLMTKTVKHFLLFPHMFQFFVFSFVLLPPEKLEKLQISYLAGDKLFIRNSLTTWSQYD